MRLKAYAKINPYLNITGKRPDGYHDLSIIFRPVSLHDTLDMGINAGESGVELSCNKPEFATEDNIIHKAYRALKECRPDIPGFRVHLIKEIPSGAGMGGGSSDGAAFLFGANVLCKLDLSLQELSQIGSRVGADVAACLRWQPTVGRGIGDELENISTHTKAYYIVVKPDVSFLTPEMYKKYDQLVESKKLSKAPDISRIIDEMKSDNLKAEASKYFNIFEKVVPEKKLISLIKKALISEGAVGAVMTGSGSCVVGAYETRGQRNRALKKLQGHGELVGCSFYPCENINEERSLNYVYIIRCKDDSLYTGWTNNIEKRFQNHSHGRGAKYTKAHGAEELIYCEMFDSKSAALSRECEIKKLSRSEKLDLVK